MSFLAELQQQRQSLRNVPPEEQRVVQPFIEVEDNMHPMPSITDIFSQGLHVYEPSRPHRPDPTSIFASSSSSSSSSSWSSASSSSSTSDRGGSDSQADTDTPIPIAQVDEAPASGAAATRVGLNFDTQTNSMPHGRIYLGSFGATRNQEALGANGVTHILTVAHGLSPPVFPGIQYFRIDIFDRPEVNLLQHLDECHAFMDAALHAGGNVLVHCSMGVSRSASVVISYLMRKTGMSRDSALRLVKKSRRCVNPNDGFMEQLFQFEQLLASKIVREYGDP